VLFGLTDFFAAFGLGVVGLAICYTEVWCETCNVGVGGPKQSTFDIWAGEKFEMVGALYNVGTGFLGYLYQVEFQKLRVCPCWYQATWEVRPIQ